MKNGDSVNGTISDKKLETNVQGNGFIQKLTIKLYSNLSNINIGYYLEFRIPIMHSHVLRKRSRNPENIKTLCNIFNNPFLFACRKWCLDKQSL